MSMIHLDGLFRLIRNPIKEYSEFLDNTQFLPLDLTSPVYDMVLISRMSSATPELDFVERKSVPEPSNETYNQGQGLREPRRPIPLPKPGERYVLSFFHSQPPYPSYLPWAGLPFLPFVILFALFIGKRHHLSRLLSLRFPFSF